MNFPDSNFHKVGPVFLKISVFRFDHVPIKHRIGGHLRLDVYIVLTLEPNFIDNVRSLLHRGFLIRHSLRTSDQCCHQQENWKE